MNRTNGLPEEWRSFAGDGERAEQRAADDVRVGGHGPHQARARRDHTAAVYRDDDGCVEATLDRSEAAYVDGASLDPSDYAEVTVVEP